MAKALKETLSTFFTALITKWLEDLLILLGILFILVTTYKEFGYTTGNYALGTVFLILGFLVAKK